MEQKPFYYWCGGALLFVLVGILLLIVYFIKKRTKDNDNNKNNTSNTQILINDKPKATNINTGGWKCACEGSLFLPQSLQGSVAMFNMGVGGCYHKQT